MAVRSKYRSRKITVNGEVFDSKKEYKRFVELTLLERAGKITNLQRQVKFELLPSQRIDGKVVERPVRYIADFVYEQDGQTIVEDVKSSATKTSEYVIKRKLLLWRHGIAIKEV